MDLIQQQIQQLRQNLTNINQALSQLQQSEQANQQQLQQLQQAEGSAVQQLQQLRQICNQLSQSLNQASNLTQRVATKFGQFPQQQFGQYNPHRNMGNLASNLAQVGTQVNKQVLPRPSRNRPKLGNIPPVNNTAGSFIASNSLIRPR